MVSDRALWQAINAHNLDAADAALPFSRRLMHETGWTEAYAQRAIHEYKAFIYLVCTGGTLLSPSDAVDKVWHLHLIYTRDYWDRFCAGVLKRPVHHSPSAGGSSEDALYRDAYERTRRLYRAEFGSSPPSDLWPDADTCPQPVKTPGHTSEYIHLPKRQVFLSLAGGALALLAGCAPQDVTDLWRTHHLMAMGGLAVAWWLLVTSGQIGAIRRKGLALYLLGAVVMIPIFSVLTYAVICSVGHFANSRMDNDYTWLLAMMLGIAFWNSAYLSPRGKGGGGSGCGSGCGSGGGHGGGCGGHGCGSGCGGGH